MTAAPHLILEAFVPGRPRPKGSMDFMPNGRAVQNNEHSTPWQREMEAVFRRLVSEQGSRPGKWVPRPGYPYARPVTVFAEFTFERPLRPRIDFGVPASGSTGDVDKLSRNLLDALEEAGVYVNDTQVVDLFASARYVSVGETRGVQGVRVWVYGLAESKVSAADLRTTWLALQCDDCAPDPATYLQPVSPAPVSAPDPFALPTSAPVRMTKDVGPVFIAAYDGRCAECGEELWEGEEARYVEGEVVRVECCGVSA